MNPHDDKPPPEGWHVPGPEHIPAPSIWPASVAFSSMLLLWGLLTSPLLSAVGLLIFAGSIAAWIGEIRDDRQR